VADDQWLHRVLDRGAWVYPVALQWRTAEALFRAGRIVAPSGLRALIEAAHGPEAAPVPPVLEVPDLRAQGEALARAAHAWQNRIDLDLAFREGSRADDDAEYPTRLGQPTRVLALARSDGAVLVPWGPGWPESEVSASIARLPDPLPDQDTPEIRQAKADWPAWKREAVVLCPVGNDGRICDGLRYDPDLGLLFD
jgi:CRISPR-associated endonuclease/helicase Cas3